MKTYLVGGAVRDQLLQLPVHERDWVVVGGSPQQLLDQGYQPVGRDFPVFLHPDSKEEYALARTERKTGAGYTGFDCYASPDVSLEDDLLRRDLTINAIAQDEQGNLIDPYHGQEDLQQKVLRHVSPAFTEDPLRVLRLARFLARFAHLGFQISEDTVELATDISRSGELKTIAAERIWRELEKALNTQTPSAFFSALDQMAASDQLIPELKQLDEVISQRLDQASRSQVATEICFSLLFVEKNQQQTEQLCERLKVPKDYRELALLVCQLSPLISETKLSTGRQLELLEKTDAFRRPERFENFLRCCEFISNSTINSQQLRFALKQCKTIDAKAIAASGLKGKAIAKQLRIERLNLLDNIENTSGLNNEQ